MNTTNTVQSTSSTKIEFICPFLLSNLLYMYIFFAELNKPHSIYSVIMYNERRVLYILLYLTFFLLLLYKSMLFA